MMSSNLGPDWDQVPGIRPEPELLFERSFANNSRMRWATVILMPNSDSAWNFTSIGHFLSLFRVFTVRYSAKVRNLGYMGSGTGRISDCCCKSDHKISKKSQKMSYRRKISRWIRIWHQNHRSTPLSRVIRERPSGINSGSGRIPGTWSQSGPKFELIMKLWP